MIPHGADVRRLAAFLLLSATLTVLHAAVDVGVDTIVRPRQYELAYWRFNPAAVARCHGSDSATLSAWLTMFGPDGRQMYRDSLAAVALAPGVYFVAGNGQLRRVAVVR
jgi:hypothetical protein